MGVHRLSLRPTAFTSFTTVGSAMRMVALTVNEFLSQMCENSKSVLRFLFRLAFVLAAFNLSNHFLTEAGKRQQKNEKDAQC